MEIEMYQVDAFTQQLFGGNPAAVCVLDEWLPETIMQAIATENNQSETAFIVENETGYDIRWFTPTIEVVLCGHATLAAAHVIFHHLDYSEDVIEFKSFYSGVLKVKRYNDLIALDFPTDTLEQISAPAALSEALGIEPMITYKGKTDYMAVLPSEQDVINLSPDFALLSTLDARGVIVTAQGTESDFVSRFFGPQSGIPEDPVTGSAHTSLTPYWANELGKKSLTAIQLSARKGHLWCTLADSRVEISGYAVLYMKGNINVPDIHPISFS